MSLRDKMLAIMADVNSAVSEREELVELIAIALLTRKNLFILGDPGQAKSYAINAFRSRITGAKQFERLLSKQTDEEQLFGRLDLSSLIPGSVPESAFDGDGIYQNLRFDLQSFLSGSATALFTSAMTASILSRKLMRHLSYGRRPARSHCCALFSAAPCGAVRRYAAPDRLSPDQMT